MELTSFDVMAHVMAHGSFRASYYKHSDLWVWVVCFYQQGPGRALSLAEQCPWEVEYGCPWLDTD